MRGLPYRHPRIKPLQGFPGLMEENHEDEPPYFHEDAHTSKANNEYRTPNIES